MPGIDPYTVLLLHCNGTDGSTTFSDSSPSNHAVSAAGAAQVDTAQSKFGGGSLLLDISTAYLTTPDSPDFAFAAGDFTVDYWARWPYLPAAAAMLGHCDDATHKLGWAVRFQGGTSTLSFEYSTTGSDSHLVSVGWSPPTDTWFHQAFVRASGVFRVFVGGVQVGADASLSASFFDSPAALRVGARLGASGGDFYGLGWMDEIRVSKGIARWTSNFTPPTAPYSSEAGGRQMRGQG
jgi:hypothetical protein